MRPRWLSGCFRPVFRHRLHRLPCLHREDVDGFVQRAVAAGAKVQTGGVAIEGEGYFYAPTIVTDVAQDSEIIQDEVFGPVVTVQKFTTAEEALEMANGVSYGLSGSVMDEGSGDGRKLCEEHGIRYGQHQHPLLPGTGDALGRLQRQRHRRRHVTVLHRRVHQSQAHRSCPLNPT